ncbi:hypothetical protein GGH13_004807 [Coemansia sp. S155-1]|nr:hypothetical protein GGH13_004807 [Coemansia sp. S155-1]
MPRQPMQLAHLRNVPIYATSKRAGSVVNTSRPIEQSKPRSNAGTTDDSRYMAACY